MTGTTDTPITTAYTTIIRSCHNTHVGEAKIHQGLLGESIHAGQRGALQYYLTTVHLGTRQRPILVFKGATGVLRLVKPIRCSARGPVKTSRAAQTVYFLP